MLGLFNKKSSFIRAVSAAALLFPLSLCPTNISSHAKLVTTLTYHGLSFDDQRKTCGTVPSLGLLLPRKAEA